MLKDCSINMILQPRSILAVALVSSLAVTHAASFISVEECPLVPDCCTEDCCGPGTKWDVDTAYCKYDPTSGGFNGTYSDAWEPGCIERVCCGSDCCLPDMKFERGFCLSNSCKTSQDCTRFETCIDGTCITKPVYRKCLEDCPSGYCYNEEPEGQFFSCALCNQDTNAGCRDDQYCGASWLNTDSSASSPICRGYAGAHCTSDSQCSSHACYKETSKCAECTSVMNHPLYDDEEMYDVGCSKGWKCRIINGTHTCVPP